MHHPTDKIAHTMAYVTPVVDHCLITPVMTDKPGLTETDGNGSTRVEQNNQSNQRKKYQMFMCRCNYKKNLLVYYHETSI